MEEAETKAILRREIQALPRGKREIFPLSKYSGLSYEEIAQVVGSPPSASKQTDNSGQGFLK